VALKRCREMSLVRKTGPQGDFSNCFVGFCELMARELHSELPNITANCAAIMTVKSTGEMGRMNSRKPGEFGKPGRAGELGLENFADQVEPSRYMLAAGIISRDLRNQLPSQPFRSEGGDWILITILPIELLQQPLESRGIPTLRFTDTTGKESRASQPFDRWLNDKAVGGNATEAIGMNLASRSENHAFCGAKESFPAISLLVGSSKSTTERGSVMSVICKKSIFRIRELSNSKITHAPCSRRQTWPWICARITFDCEV
jgi:hypothetical protein